MAAQAYLMVTVAEEAYTNYMDDILKEVEGIAEVKAAEQVSGFCDLVVKVQAPSITPVVDKLLAKESVKRLYVLFVRPTETLKSQTLGNNQLPKTKKPIPDR